MAGKEKLDTLCLVTIMCLSYREDACIFLAIVSVLTLDSSPFIVSKRLKGKFWNIIPKLLKFGILFQKLFFLSELFSEQT